MARLDESGQPPPVLTAPLFPELHERLVGLLGRLSPEDWERPTSAGAWRVRDVVAHMIDGDLRRISSDRDGHFPPAPATPMGGYADLVAHLDRLNADWVDAARRISPQLLLQLIRLTGPELATVMSALAPSVAATFPVAWTGHRASPAWLDVGREFTERWHHQDQIREAVAAAPVAEPHLLRPVIAISTFALPHAYAQVTAPPGSCVHLRVVGAAGGSWALVRSADAWRLEVAAQEPPGIPDCIVEADDLGFARLLLHRLNADQARSQLRVSGDHALAEPLLHARAVMV